MAAPASPHCFPVKKPTPSPSLRLLAFVFFPARASFSSPFSSSTLILLSLPLLILSPQDLSLGVACLVRLLARTCFLLRLERGRKTGMGSCASVHNKDLGFPKKQFLASPTKAKAGNGKGGGVALVGDGLGDLKAKAEAEQQRVGFGPKSPDSGSKDEVFFESRAWLDSDCEDDFYSVNGDFTPSRGSTPNYQPRTQTVMTNIFQPDNSDKSKSPEPSPTGRSKLAELLLEAMQNDPDESTDVSKNEKQQLQSVAADEKPVSETTSSSACSTQPTPTLVAKSRKEKAWYTGHCCLPSFVHSLALDESERGQKMSSRPCAV